MTVNTLIAYNIKHLIKPVIIAFKYKRLLAVHVPCNFRVERSLLFHLAILYNVNDFY